jgi:hypothetical protein
MYLTYNFKDNLWMNENPIKELWDLIPLCLYPEKLNTIKSYCYKPDTYEMFHYYLKQSHDLYIASTNTMIESSPLLQFYSFSTLSKILVLIQTRLNNESLKHGHGLQIVIDDPKIIGLENIKVRIQEGTFYYLIQSLPRPISKELYLNKIISLKELLSSNIDLFDYGYSNAMPISKINFLKKADDQHIKKEFHIAIRLHGKQEKETFEIAKSNYAKFNFEKFQTHNVFVVSMAGFPIFFEFDDIEELPEFVPEKRFNNESFIVPFVEANDSTKLPFYQIEILYMISFIASNLVRYYPRHWLEIISKKEKYWELKKSLSMMNRSFPNYFLNFITEEFHMIYPTGTLHRS